LAHGALFECLRRGIAVPQQLAVAGFNDLAASNCTVPALTTIATPRYDIGAQSALLLLSLIDGKEPPRPSIDLGFELKARQSV